MVKWGRGRDEGQRSEILWGRGGQRERERERDNGEDDVLCGPSGCMGMESVAMQAHIYMHVCM